jgi:superoxide dismutase, Fe-Mn family
MKLKLLPILFLVFVGISCKNKKFTEVTVPLPEEKSAAAVILDNPDDVLIAKGKYEMEKLPFQYNTFESEIKGFTMKLHYSKVYYNFTNNFNKIATQFGIDNKPVEEIVRVLDVSNQNLRFTAGGYYNHKLFFESFTNKKSLLLEGDFKTVANFKLLIKNNAGTQIGSGWVWLILDENNKLQITNTQNEDNPMMHNAEIKGTPLLGIDLWEHAYISENQINRNLYIDKLLANINWDILMRRYAAAVK